MIREGKMKAYRIKERKKDEAEHPNPTFGEQACVTGCWGQQPLNMTEHGTQMPAYTGRGGKN